MLLIPQSIAYAELAGLPSIYGLYAAFVPILLGALFGHMNQLASGPTAMSSIITAAVLSQAAVPGSAEYIQMAILLAFLVGVIRLLFGLLRMAVLVNLISHPVVIGFTNAGAMVIALSQAGKVLGISLPKHQGLLGTLRDGLSLLGSLSEVHFLSLVLGVFTICLIILVKKLRPRWPAILLAVVAVTVVSRLIGFESRWGGNVVGLLPEGMPPSSLPSLPGSFPPCPE